MKIFISYRRDDTLPYAGRLCDALAEAFGAENVFMDIDSINPGKDFVSVLDEAMKDSQVLLVLIGRQWLTIRSPSGQRRLDDTNDFVRKEIIAGMARNLTVIPVLVQNASMPSAGDLPEPLTKLGYYQACELSDTRWKYDTRQLVRAIRRSQPPDLRKRLVWAAASLGVALVALIGVFLWNSHSPPTEQHSTNQIDTATTNVNPNSATNSIVSVGLTNSIAIPANQVIAAVTERRPSTAVVSSDSTNILFKQSDPTKLKRRSYINEVRILQASNNVVDLEIDYKYRGDHGPNNIVMRAEAFNVRGNKFAGSRSPAVGIGEGTVELRLTVPDVWLPLTTTNLDIAFYLHDEPNRTFDYLEGETILFTKEWK